jgi:hypothetical protein
VIDDPNEWLDNELLVGDVTRERNWRRNALNGLSISDCVAAIPTFGQFQVRLQLPAFRYFKQFCEDEGTKPYFFARDAVIEACRKHPRFDQSYIDKMAP